jgi:site-specific DNA recombinase
MQAKRRARRQNVPQGDIGRACAYLRVSTDRQELGPDAQRLDIERFAEREGVQIVSWHQDVAVSGLSEGDDRAGWSDCLAVAREQRAGLVIVCRRDRLARDLGVMLAMERSCAAAGARIVSAAGEGTSVKGDDGPSQALVRGVVDTVARYERDAIAARTRMALAALRRAGKRCGEIPFGYQLCPDGKSLEPSDREQEVILRILELHEDGATIRDIVATLAEEKHVSRTGRPLVSTQVHRIIRRARQP